MMNVRDVMIGEVIVIVIVTAAFAFAFTEKSL
ncbi:MAG: hypothetical protein ACI8RD_010834 [Bacillariaceae sp.]|jgi:hypothetical protein